MLEGLLTSAQGTYSIVRLASFDQVRGGRQNVVHRPNQDTETHWRHVPGIFPRQRSLKPSSYETHWLPTLNFHAPIFRITISLRSLTDAFDHNLTSP